jgi:hypothetical protein
MKYIANPVIVDAYKIVEIEDKDDDLEYYLTLENGDKVTAGISMYIRHEPAVGDYWVIQSDGYVYLNPAFVFERKYSKVEE